MKSSTAVTSSARRSATRRRSRPTTRCSNTHSRSARSVICRPRVWAPRFPTEHLVVAPILTSGDQLLGVLVVTRMPFFALNEDSLRVLSLLLGLYADSVVVSERVGQVMAQVPRCPYDFADELVKLVRLQTDYGINSHIVVLQFAAHPERVDMILFATRLRRRFDVQWQFGGGDRESTGIANLMPLASELAVRGYLERMEAALKDRFGGDFETLRVRPYVISLQQHEPLGVLGRIVSGEAE